MCALMLFYSSRQQALLAAISEKDANIALLELSASNKKKTQEEVLALKRERDKLMHQLKQHVRIHSEKLNVEKKKKVICDLDLDMTFNQIYDKMSNFSVPKWQLCICSFLLTFF